MPLKWQMINSLHPQKCLEQSECEWLLFLGDMIRVTSPALAKGSDNIRLLTRANYCGPLSLMKVLGRVDVHPKVSGASDKDPPTPYSANTPIAREENLPTRLHGCQVSFEEMTSSTAYY